LTIHQHGVAEQIIKLIPASGISVNVFSDIQPDPTVQNVYDGLRAFGESRSEVIVALGGGSPIDAAKAISIMATNHSSASIWGITRFRVLVCRLLPFLPPRAQAVKSPK
jgi:alcohol dehydrogenase class IV